MRRGRRVGVKVYHLFAFRCLRNNIIFIIVQGFIAFRDQSEFPSNSLFSILFEEGPQRNVESHYWTFSIIFRNSAERKRVQQSVNPPSVSSIIYYT